MWADPGRTTRALSSYAHFLRQLGLLRVGGLLSRVPSALLSNFRISLRVSAPEVLNSIAFTPFHLFSPKVVPAQDVGIQAMPVFQGARLFGASGPQRDGRDRFTRSHSSLRFRSIARPFGLARYVRFAPSLHRVALSRSARNAPANGKCGYAVKSFTRLSETIAFCFS